MTANLSPALPSLTHHFSTASLTPYFSMGIRILLSDFKTFLLLLHFWLSLCHVFYFRYCQWWSVTFVRYVCKCVCWGVGYYYWQIHTLIFTIHTCLHEPYIFFKFLWFNSTRSRAFWDKLATFLWEFLQCSYTHFGWPMKVNGIGDVLNLRGCFGILFVCRI